MKKSPWLRRWLAAVILVAATFLLFAAALAWDGLHDRRGPAGVMLVLGTGGIRHGVPSARLRARLDRAVEMERRPGLQCILVSGGGAEADVMAGYLAAHGVDRDRIALDREGWTTYDSARHTALFLRAHGLRGVLVVTQYFHVSRTRLALERFGVEPVFSTHARLIEWHDAYSLSREVAGWIVYRFRDYRLPRQDA